MDSSAPKPPTASGPCWILRAAPIVILLAVVFAYHNALDGPFIFDDHDYMLKDASIRRLWPSREGQNARRPVGKFTLAVNYALAPPNETRELSPWGFKLGNVIIHTLAALTLYGVVRRTFLTPTLAPRFGAESAALAGVIALLWAVHPLQTQAVTYTIQRFESLMGLFYFLTFYGFIRSATAGGPVSKWPWGAVAVIACALGMGTKEVIVTAPVLALLYDRCFLAGSFRAALRRRWKLHAALAATWVVIAGLIALDVLYPTALATSGFGIRSVTPLQYALTQPAVIVHYLRLSFWPSPLVLDYLWPAARTPAEIIPSLLVIVILLAGTIRALVRRPAFGFLGAWFFGVLSVTSSVVPIADLAMEHRMYLPLAAVIAGVVMVIRCVIERIASTPARATRLTLAAACAAIAVAIAFAELTTERNQTYASASAIWKDTTDKRPQNWRAWRNLAAAYMDPKEGRLEDAAESYRQSLSIRKDDPDGRFYLGVVLTYLSDYQGAAAEFEEAWKLKPRDPRIAAKLGEVLLRMGRVPECLRVTAESLDGHVADAELWMVHGEALTAARRRGEALDALRHARSALGEKTAYARGAFARESARFAVDTLLRLARDLADNASFDEARGAADHALDLLPNHAEAYSTLGNIELMAGSKEKAIAAHRKAVALSPDGLEYKRRLAATLLYGAKPGSPETQEAVRLAKEACVNSPMPSSLMTLADAQAASGDARAAAETLEAAIDAYERWGNKSAAESLRRRREALIPGGAAVPQTAPAPIP